MGTNEWATSITQHVRSNPRHPWATFTSPELPTVAVIVFVLLAGLIAPVLAAIISILGFAAISKRPTIIGGTAVGVVAVLLAWINTGKGIQGDWSWYVLHYQILENTPLSEYLGARLPIVTPEPTEPIYYAFARVLSVASGANVELLAVAVTLVIYGTLGAAIISLVVTVDGRPWTVIGATVAGMFVGLTFTLSTHLVRQEIAAALIGLAIVASAKRRWLPAVMILIVASLTHNSALIPAAGLVLATLFLGHGKSLVLRFIIGGVIFYALGRLYLATLGDVNGRDDGSISTAVILLDVAVLAAFLFLIRKRGLNDNPIASTILMCIPAFYGFVLGVASQPLPLLRMYFFVEILRALMVVFVCAHLMQGRWRLIVGVVIILVPIAYLTLRIQQSPFDYDNSLTDILLWMPLADFFPD
ncbi:EpsG family protein [Cryobacterium sp. Y11]|uniref:EpsG family protein n=1 Tax=Cryobacterium sp. Y11 TaxID=2045016 RepID=UPI0011B07B3C|nr:EpsG family protein [Cryobacterium sp. Y11]